VHETAGSGLVERVKAQDRLSMGDGGVVLAAVLQEPDEALEGAEVSLAKALTVGQDPVVVATGEQIASVEACGLLKGLAGGGLICRSIGLGQGLLKGGHVDRGRGTRMPLHVLDIDIEVGAIVRQGAPEAVEKGAQVAAGLGLCRIGPELEGEVGAGLRCVAVNEKVGQEGLEPRCSHASHCRAIMV
jgi:hypothetical protein